MSVTITSQHLPLQYQGQANTNKQNVNAAVDIKDKVPEVFTNKENRVETRIESRISNMNERLANHATDSVNISRQHAAERVDTIRQFIEHRLDGGHEVTEEKAEALIGKLELKAEAHIGALDERSTKISVRLDELEQRAIEKGYDGNKIAEHADRVTEYFQQRMEGVDEHLEQTIERIQSWVEDAYKITPEADVDETLDNDLITDLTA